MFIHQIQHCILNKKERYSQNIFCQFIKSYRINAILGNNNKVPVLNYFLFLKVDLIITLPLNSSLNNLGLKWISQVSTLCDRRLHSVLRNICDALRIHIVELRDLEYYTTPFLVLSPIIRDYVAWVCVSLLFYLTHPKHF